MKMNADYYALFIIRYIHYKINYITEMIIAKLNPGISVINQNSPFESPVTTTYNWMSAIVQRYIPGAANYSVKLVYGTVTMDEADALPMIFRNVGGSLVELTAEEISTWGTNDVVLLEILATKLNLTIESTYEIEDMFQ
jgi:hypothetical protein